MSVIIVTYCIDSLKTLVSELFPHTFFNWCDGVSLHVIAQTIVLLSVVRFLLLSLQFHTILDTIIMRHSTLLS